MTRGDSSSASAADWCPLCGGADARPLAPPGGTGRQTAAYARCADCSHIYLHPIPAEETLEHHYRQLGLRGEDAGAVTRAPAPILSPGGAESYKVELLKSQPHLATEGMVLEISFGARGFIFRESHAGWRGLVAGSEGEAAADATGDSRGVRAFVEALREIRAETFGLLLMWDVVGRLPRPVEALRLAGRALSADGHLIATAPNAVSLEARVRKSHWYARQGEAAPWRLQQFNPRTLGLALCEAGLFPEEVRAVAFEAALLSAALGHAGRWLGLPSAMAATARRNPLWEQA